MYRPNLPHQNLQSCDGNCFDDLCNDCKDYIKSSDDESSFDQSFTNQSTVNPFALNRSANSTDGSSADEASDHERSSEPSLAELNRLCQQVSDHTRLLEKHFRKFDRALNRLNSRLLQLHRQNDHCCDLLTTLEDHLQGLQEQMQSAVNCDEWFMQLNVLKMMLDTFDDDIEPHIERLNDHMERLYDLFERENAQLTKAAQTMENLERHSTDQRFLFDQIAKAQLPLNRIDSNLEELVQEQRQVIIEFVGMMDAIVQGVLSALASDEIAAEFDCFSGQQFLQEFNKTLNKIQII